MFSRTSNIVAKTATRSLGLRTVPLLFSRNYQVVLNIPLEGKVAIECPDKTYILDAAEENNISLPYSCRAGACSSCVGRLTSGTVDQSDQVFLDSSQLAQGYVLTCVAIPLSNCTILTNQEENIF